MGLSKMTDFRVASVKCLSIGQRICGPFRLAGFSSDIPPAHVLIKNSTREFPNKLIFLKFYLRQSGWMTLFLASISAHADPMWKWGCADTSRGDYTQSERRVDCDSIVTGCDTHESCFISLRLHVTWCTLDQRGHPYTSVIQQKKLVFLHFISHRPQFAYRCQRWEVLQLPDIYPNQ